MYLQNASARWPKAGFACLIQPIMLAIVLTLFLVTSCPADDRQDVRVVLRNSQPTAKQRPSVVFISCCLPNGFFWPQVESFMRAASDDLGIDLEVQYAEMNHLHMVDMAKEVIHRPRPPDYVIADNYKQMAEPIIREAEQAGVNVFLMANGFLPPQSERMGTPRSQFKHWIGELTADNYDAGFQLAERLIAEVKMKGTKAVDGRFHLVALAGDSATPAGLERVRGLEASIARHPDVVLSQVVRGLWQEENARRLMPRILRRYPEITGIWVANDEMALGALAAVQAAGRTPGRDIFIAGINWKREALEKVRDGDLVVSIGGHFMMGGWALVLLHDHYHGRDFSDQALQLRIPMFQPLERNTVPRYLELFGKEDWGRIDFAAFSKVKKPQIERYDFSVDHLLSAFRPAAKAGRK